MSDHRNDSDFLKLELPSNFIHDIIEEELLEGGRCHEADIHTRFPPEPNGYLHIGHAKAIAINFGTAEKYGGVCNLRMDDTNPTKEDVEYVNSIKTDIEWLGFDWDDRLYYASDYFEKMFSLATELIEKGLAYVCTQTAEEVRANRGDLTLPAVSPFRDRPASESMDLFNRMREGEFEDGAMTLRAKIDLASGNFNMRDPVIYRIAHVHHHRQEDAWCIYPMYDYAHPIEDMLEGITHSLCSLEFEDHRPLYNWVRDNVSVEHKPRQIEFARLNLTHTVMSKRKLLRLVEEGVVSGWDDPRMPTLSGLRRRGYTPYAIRDFINRVGIAKVVSTVEHDLLEHCLREHLNDIAIRAMAVLRPLKLTITNYPENKVETLSVANHPDNAEFGRHDISFSRTVWIERDDFMEVPEKKFFRLSLGGEVRLRSAYAVKCNEVIKDENGEIVELLCTYDADTKSGAKPADGRKIKGTIHWVDDLSSEMAQVNLYDSLFTEAFPEENGRDFFDCLNEKSLEILSDCRVERYLIETAKEDVSYQFLRSGYFCVDNKAFESGNIIFNRTVGLKGAYKPKN